MSAASSPQATPKHKLRWYQYSLRTLLLPVMLALVLSGVYIGMALGSSIGNGS